MTTKTETKAIEASMQAATRGRTPGTPEQPTTAIAVSPAAAQRLADTQDQHTLVVQQQDKAVTALAVKLNYQGSTDIGVLQNSARDATRRIGMAIFELGGYLLLIKAQTDHGQFEDVLNDLGVHPRAAQRYMAITDRFAKATTSSHLEQLGFSKMAELLPLDEGQTDELVEQGQTGQLALDDVSRMSVRELRAAVHKERKETEKHKARAERQEAVNAELHEEVRLIKRMPASEEIKRTKQEATTIQAETLGLVQGGLRHALIALNNCAEDQSLFMAGLVGQVMAELVTLRDEFSLPEVGGTPEWERWAAAQSGESAATATTAPN